MVDWPDGTSCEKCGTTRIAIGRRNASQCVRCFDIISELSNIERSFDGETIDKPPRSREQFLAACRREAEHRLGLLQLQEAKINGDEPVDALDVSYLLILLRRKNGLRRALAHARYMTREQIEKVFGPEQRRVLYEWLTDLTYPDRYERDIYVTAYQSEVEAGG